MLVTREDWTFWGISQKKAGKMSINESMPSVIMFKILGDWDNIDASIYHPRATWWFGVWNFKNACALHERWRFFFGTNFCFLEKFQIRTQSMGGWLTVKISTSTENSPLSPNMRFPRRTSKVMKTGPFLVGSKGDQPMETGFDSTKNAVEKFWDLGKITMKSPLRISFVGKKTWKSKRLRNSWKFSEWKTGSFTLNHFPFDAQGEMGTFRLIYKENRDSENGIPWLWRRWWSGMVIQFPHQKARCFSMCFPLIKR